MIGAADRTTGAGRVTKRSANGSKSQSGMLSRW